MSSRNEIGEIVATDQIVIGNSKYNLVNNHDPALDKEIMPVAAEPAELQRCENEGQTNIMDPMLAYQCPGLPNVQWYSLDYLCRVRSQDAERFDAHLRQELEAERQESAPRLQAEQQKSDERLDELAQRMVQMCREDARAGREDARADHAMWLEESRADHAMWLEESRADHAESMKSMHEHDHKQLEQLKQWEKRVTAQDTEQLVQVGDLLDNAFRRLKTLEQVSLLLYHVVFCCKAELNLHSTLLLLSFEILSYVHSSTLLGSIQFRSCTFCSD